MHRWQRPSGVDTYCARFASGRSWHGKRAAIYVRVSTANRSRDGNGFEQNPEVQEIPLRQLVQQRGWTLARVYSDRLAEQRRIARA